ncbi:MAG: hypothetical protein GX905_08500 [Bacteroidales bacterium]|nr:hypothetical protein [Bacteroidales bacterium]
MTENEVVAELSANVAIVGYSMNIMIAQIAKREIMNNIPKTNNEVCDSLFRGVNELIKENNELKARLKE